MAKMIVDRSARRATRAVVGGARSLDALKRAAHRRERRNARQAIRAGRDIEPARRVTGRDVA